MIQMDFIEFFIKFLIEFPLWQFVWYKEKADCEAVGITLKSFQTVKTNKFHLCSEKLGMKEEFIWFTLHLNLFTYSSPMATIMTPVSHHTSIVFLYHIQSA